MYVYLYSYIQDTYSLNFTSFIVWHFSFKLKMIQLHLEQVVIKQPNTGKKPSPKLLPHLFENPNIPWYRDRYLYNLILVYLQIFSALPHPHTDELILNRFLSVGFYIYCIYLIGKWFFPVNCDCEYSWRGEGLLHKLAMNRRHCYKRATG